MHHPRPVLAIDGAYGEGGGQLLRTAVALAAVTRRSIVIDNIRAGRPQPGLAAQHRTAIAAAAALCDAEVGGLALRSRSLTFTPGTLRGGSHRFDIGTAGSVTLVLHALLPVLVACGEPADVTLRGGTDVRAAPPLDYFAHVTLPLLARMGIDARLAVRRRGYFPRGGGQVAQRGVRAETLGSAVASELTRDLGAGVCLDVHAGDQIPVYLALAGSGSFSTREVTRHARTAMWLIEQFLPVRFECTAEGPRIRVRVVPTGAASR